MQLAKTWIALALCPLYLLDAPLPGRTLANAPTSVGMLMVHDVDTSERDDGATDSFVCPPCGHDCLETKFDAPGTCTECGMPLVRLTQELVDAHASAKAAERDRDTTRMATKRDEDTRTRVAILIFEQVEIIDFTGPWEVFGAAGYDVYAVATTPDAIRTNNGMQVVPSYTLEECPSPDVLLVPGGGVGRVSRNDDVRLWLQSFGETSELVLSVCNGAFILATAGMLDGLAATTTRSLTELFAKRFPKVDTKRNRRWVDNGKIITAGGLSAGIDAALHVVERLEGRERADEIASSLEYEWRHNPADDDAPN